MSPTRYHCATPLHSLKLWRPHEDSNPELLITKQAFCRLNYGAFNMVQYGGDGRNRTDGLLLAKQTLSQHELHIPTNFPTGWASGT